MNKDVPINICPEMLSLNIIWLHLFVIEIIVLFQKRLEWNSKNFTHMTPSLRQHFCKTRKHYLRDQPHIT